MTKRFVVSVMIVMMAIVGFHTAWAQAPDARLTVNAQGSGQGGNNATNILDLYPTFTGDTFGDVGKDMRAGDGYLNFDAMDMKSNGDNTYTVRAHLDPPVGVKWNNDNIDHPGPYKPFLGINGVKSMDAGWPLDLGKAPKGVWVDDTTVDYTFPCFKGKARLNLPIQDANGNWGFGWIYPAPYEVKGKDNGYANIECPCSK